MTTLKYDRPQADEATSTTAAPIVRLASRKLVAIVALVAMVIGAGSMLGGVAGAAFTWQQAAVEDITTPGDAMLPEVPVRGPLSMYAQSEIITEHQLDRTEGLRYSQMDREVAAVDEAGQPIVGDDGEPMMVENADRMSWIDATSLTTVLNVGIMAYALAAFAFVVGLTLLGVGTVLWQLRRQLPAIA